MPTRKLKMTYEDPLRGPHYIYMGLYCSKESSEFLTSPRAALHICKTQRTPKSVCLNVTSTSKTIPISSPSSFLICHPYLGKGGERRGQEVIFSSWAEADWKNKSKRASASHVQSLSLCVSPSLKWPELGDVRWALNHGQALIYP